MYDVFPATIGGFFCKTHACICKQFRYWYPLNTIFNALTLLYNMTPNFNKLILLTNTSVLNLQLSIILIILVILSGDVETHPGPYSTCQNLSGCVSITHLNIRSIRNKLDFIQTLMEDFQISCFTETHLSENISNDLLAVDGFHCYRKDKTNHSGGLITYISTELISNRRTDLETVMVHSLWNEVTYHGKTILVCNVYRPPSSPVSFWDNFNISLEKAIESTPHIVVLGDINENQLSANTKFNQILLLNNLINVITVPTRITESTSTSIDPVAVSTELHVLDSGTIDVPVEISDHKGTYVHIRYPFNSFNTVTRKVWLYNKADYAKLNQLISEENWNFIDIVNVNDATVKFNETLLKLMKECIPNKEVTIRKNDKPWYDSEIRKYSRKRDRQKVRAINSNNTLQWLKYKQLRNKVNNLKKHAKEHFFSNLEEIVHDASINDQKTYWKCLKLFMKSNKSLNSIPPLKTPTTDLNENFAFTDIEKANLLNTYFVSISSIENNNAALPELTLLTDSVIETIEVTENEIIEIINTLMSNKAVGEDLISHRVLKNIKLSIAKPLCKLFNKSLLAGTFPDQWKMAIVMPLFKKGDVNSTTNYRPISLLSCVGKLMERVIYKHLYNHLISNNLIYAKQSGFLTGHSTVYQLIDIYNQLAHSLDSKLHTCFIFCDISKAFDRVWHRGLIFKLKQCGFSGQILQWIRSYLSNRKQKVFVGSSLSEVLAIQAGVPQGSVLGPLLFLVYVNDIVDKLLSISRLFADDTSIAFTSNNVLEMEAIMNQDLQIISKWAKTWQVSFNPSKTEAIFISSSRDLVKPSLMFDNVPVQYVEHHKHLGLTMSCDGKWHVHIDNLLTSSSKILGMMRKIKLSVKRKTLEQLYTSFLRPILEYASVVWDGCTVLEKDKLEKIQHEAARIVSGLTRSVSLDRLYKEISWSSLSERRTYQKLLLAYKIKTHQTPGYLSDLFPNMLESVPYNLRNPFDFTVINRRTELFSKSFVPSAISLWNNLPNNIKELNSLSQFKTAVNSHILKRNNVPTYYYSGERLYSVMHARLRNKCSNLNYDLLRNHLTEDGACACGFEREDAEHYMLQCHIFLNARLILFRKLHKYHPLSINTLLTGSPILNNEDNMCIFQAVQSFIKDTKRF